MYPLQLFKDFIRSHGIEGLEKQLSIKANSRNGLTSLSYDQVKSPTHNKVVANCRGTIVDSDNNIVALPFERFHNVEKQQKFTLQEGTIAANKVDGSLIIMYHYNGKWNFASSAQPDLTKGLIRKGDEQSSLFELVADFITQTPEKTVFNQDPTTLNEWKGVAYFTEIEQEWYNKRIDEINECIGSSLDAFTDFTIMLELASPYNKVVVEYDNVQLDIIGARHRVTGDEFSLPKLEEYIQNNDVLFSTVKYAVINTLNEVDEYVKQLSEEQGCMIEGLVLTQPDGSRYKYKTNSYVAKHHAKWDKDSQKSILGKKYISRLILTNEYEEFLSYFPEYKEQLDPILEMLADAESKLRVYIPKAIEFGNNSVIAHHIPKPYSNAIISSRELDDSENTFQEIFQRLKVALLKKYK